MNKAKQGKEYAEANLLALISDSVRFRILVSGMTGKARTLRLQKVVAIETLGTPVGAAVAAALNGGLVLLRKGAARARSKYISELYKDYTHADGTQRRRKRMSLLSESICSNDQTLIVDDAIDSAGQFFAARQLIKRRNGVFVAGMVLTLCTPGRKRCECSGDTVSEIRLEHDNFYLVEPTPV